VKICLFTPTFLPLLGGAERDADAIARGLTARGHEVHVLARKVPGETPELPYPVTRYRRPPRQHLWPGVLARPLKHLHARFPFEVVLTTYGYPTGHAAIQARSTLRTPVVACPQGADLYPDYHELSKPGVAEKIRQAYRRADRLIAISGWMHDRLREVAGPDLPPVDGIPNGIDLTAHDAALELARLAPCPVGRPFALHLGRVVPTKRVDVAVQAMERAADAFRARGWRYVIVGDGASLNEIRRRIQAAGLQDVILTPGAQRGAARDRYLAHAQCLVSSSRNEGHPNVLIAAMASGLPALVSDIGAHREMLEGHDWGRTFREGDPDDLARALQAMMDEDRKPLRDAAMAGRSAYGLDKMIDGYERTLREALEQGVAHT